MFESLYNLKCDNNLTYFMYAHNLFLSNRFFTNIKLKNSNINKARHEKMYKYESQLH